MEWFAFKASDEIFGMDTQYVYRVVDDIRVTPVPFTPSCYLGLFYYRGELFEIIDIAALFELGKSNRRTDHCVLILTKWSDKRWGLLPDQTLGLLWTDKDNQNGQFDDGQTVRYLRPEDIWDALTGLPYGPGKV